MKLLYLIRGAQGSGKSTLAKALIHTGLATHHLETDQYFTDGAGEYRWRPWDVVSAHMWCQETCESLMKLGDSIVVANTFTRTSELEPYYHMGAGHYYKVQEIILRHPVFENQHGVSPVVVAKFQHRLMEDLRNPIVENLVC